MDLYSEIDVAISTPALDEFQKYVLTLMAAGYNLIEIAQESHYATQSIKNIAYDIRQQLHTRTNAQAVFIALLSGQISQLEILETMTKKG